MILQVSRLFMLAVAAVVRVQVLVARVVLAAAVLAAVRLRAQAKMAWQVQTDLAAAAAAVVKIWQAVRVVMVLSLFASYK